MRNLRHIVPLSMIVLGSAVAPNVARAEMAPAALDHYHQTGLGLMPGLGYRVIVPYSDNKTCGEESCDGFARIVCSK